MHVYTFPGAGSAHLGRTLAVFNYSDIRFLPHVCHLLVRCVKAFQSFNTPKAA